MSHTRLLHILRYLCASVAGACHSSLKLDKATAKSYVLDSISNVRITLAQYKGGPSKGGFLNNRLISYTGLYLYNEINGMCI